MDKLIMLGTGNGGTLNLYNTCFVIQNLKGNFLIDTGGGIEIIKRLKNANIELENLNNIFISHSHTDHILGLFWLFKILSVKFMHGRQNDHINLYCNDVVFDAIKVISKSVLSEKLVQIIFNVFNFIVVKDNDEYIINDNKFTFFDIKAKGTKQFGFKTNINNKKFVFLGDETLNVELYDLVKNADYVTHEAFCLDSEEHIFHAYEKNHSTVKSVCEIMNKLNVKNLILYHTEESHGEDRKNLYFNEGSKYYNGNLLIPNDMETIEIM